jgi:hypothetical protein
MTAELVESQVLNKCYNSHKVLTSQPIKFTNPTVFIFLADYRDDIIFPKSKLIIIVSLKICSKRSKTCYYVNQYMLKAVCTY